MNLVIPRKSSLAIALVLLHNLVCDGAGLICFVGAFSIIFTSLRAAVIDLQEIQIRATLMKMTADELDIRLQHHFVMPQCEMINVST
jgi:hypothetical protein